MTNDFRLLNLLKKFLSGYNGNHALALMHGAQAHAAMAGRDFAEPEDVKAVAADIWCHRLICRGFSLSQTAEAPAEILSQILRQVEAPTEPASL